MKKNLLCLLILLSGISCIYAQQSIPGKGAEYCSKQKIKHQSLLHSQAIATSAQIHSFDVLNYEIHLDLMGNFSTPSDTSFAANEIITFRVDSVLSSIVLNAVNTSLTIDSVLLAGTDFEHQNDQLFIQLNRTYNPGEIVDIQIFYHHNNVADGAVYVSGGFFFTDCEPEGARKWFPCYDSPGDKATVDITAKVPSNVLLGSNGRLQDSIPDANSITYHWISRDPVATYLVVVTAKVNYKLDIVEWQDTISNQTIPIRFYYNANENPDHIENLIGEMTSYYSAEYGDHPFEKNGFTTLNNQFIWGGMENQTLTSLCPNCWEESLVAHEFAHQWFGDMITCATWADIFLNEGFATWSEAHWIEHTGGYSAYKNEMNTNASNYIFLNPGWAISDSSWAVNTPDINTLFNWAITYMKGSCVMHELRYVLGDSLFFAGLKAYAADTNLRYKSATIADFRSDMENISGQDLKWFFDEWIYKPNHPLYRNVYAIKHMDNGKWRVQFTARQLNATTDTYWQMPVELKINFINLTDTVIKVFNSFNDQIFTFYFDVQPVNLYFDPSNQIILKQGSTIVSTEESDRISGIRLSASPSPFDASTKIQYELTHSSNTCFFIIDQLGRTVNTIDLGIQTSGEHTYTLDGSVLTSGVYYLRMKAGDEFTTITLIRK